MIDPRGNLIARLNSVASWFEQSFEIWNHRKDDEMPLVATIYVHSQVIYHLSRLDGDFHHAF
jgi:hypothetical protein